MKLKTRYALLLALLLPPPVLAAGSLSHAEPVQVAQADCYAAGQRIASERGGSLVAVRSEIRGGRPACIIVIMLPGAGGKHPRLQEIVLPQ